MRFGRVGCGALLLGGALLAGCDAAVDVEVVEGDEECVALLPKPPLRPSRVDVPVASPAACGEALTDHVGQLHVVERSTTPGGPGAFHEYTAAGAPNGLFTTSGVVELVPQFSGFTGLVGVDTSTPRLVFRRNGALPTSAPLDTLGREGLRADLSGVPDLGALALVSGTVPGVGAVLSAERRSPFGDAISLAPGVAVSAEPHEHLAGAVNLNGTTLAVWQSGGAVRARWVRQEGSVLGTEQVLAGVPAGATPVLRPLLPDASIALKSAGAWRLRLDASGAAAPAPAWLAATGDTDLFVVRNRTGYALTPPPGVASPTCTQAVEVRTPSGRLCGRVHLRQGSGACTTAPVRVGLDGSVVERVAGSACGYRVWPGMLR